MNLYDVATDELIGIPVVCGSSHGIPRWSEIFGDVEASGLFKCTGAGVVVKGTLDRAILDVRAQGHG